MISTAFTMIDLHPHSSPNHAHIDTVLYGDTIDALLEASRTAQQCAHGCLHESNPPTRCVEVCLDIADLCAAAANVVIRMSDPACIVATLQACREVLRVGEDACRNDCGHLRICAVSAAVFESAEEQCHRFEVTLSRSDPTRNDPALPHL